MAFVCKFQNSLRFELFRAFRFVETQRGVALFQDAPATNVPDGIFERGFMMMFDDEDAADGEQRRGACAEEVEQGRVVRGVGRVEKGDVERFASPRSARRK